MANDNSISSIVTQNRTSLSCNYLGLLRQDDGYLLFIILVQPRIDSSHPMGWEGINTQRQVQARVTQNGLSQSIYLFLLRIEKTYGMIVIINMLHI